jgi:hypothetical protein
MFGNKVEVIEIKDVPQSSVGAPSPVVFSDEHNLYCAFYLQNTPEEWDGTSIKMMDIDPDDEPIAIVKFPHFLVFQFGPPNDESFNGHPLYKKGLKPYGVYEIKNSSWIRYFEKMNFVNPYHRSEHFRQLKHFIFSFHDTTLEVIAEKYEIETINGSIEKAILKIQDNLK